MEERKIASDDYANGVTNLQKALHQMRNPFEPSSVPPSFVASTSENQCFTSTDVKFTQISPPKINGVPSSDPFNDDFFKNLI